LSDNPPPTTPPHRWGLVCPHRGCDMCRFAAATALEKPRWCLPMESEGPSGHRSRTTSVTQNAGLKARRPSARPWETQQRNHHGSRPGLPASEGIQSHRGSFSAGLQETVERGEFHDMEAPCIMLSNRLCLIHPVAMDQANGGPFCVVIAQDFLGMGGKLPSFQGVGGELPGF
jgi:hypothetical protein